MGADGCALVANSQIFVEVEKRQPVVLVPVIADARGVRGHLCMWPRLHFQREEADLDKIFKCGRKCRLASRWRIVSKVDMLNTEPPARSVQPVSPGHTVTRVKCGSA